jgi:GTP:adenosylcobinamide-phosphate guanylyltransferase
MGVKEFDEPIIIVSSELSFLLDCIFFSVLSIISKVPTQIYAMHGQFDEW